MDDVGGVGGVLVHVDGVGGAVFFIISLRGCEEFFEVFPCFVRIGLVVPFFNGVGEDTCVAQDGFADADELRVSFWCAVGFR